MSPNTPTPFGAPMLKHFLIDPKLKHLNHGSFGTYPVQVQTALRQFQAEAEAHSDIFIRRTQPKGIDAARQALAAFLNVSVNECVLVKNATTGVNTILHNLDFAEGDVIIYFDTVYGAVEKSLVFLMEKTPGLKARKVEYALPISHDDLVNRFREVVRKTKAEGLNVRVSVFDTIVSNPGVRFPFERLTEACREEGVLSLIDGAHGIGHIPLDLGMLNPDFFTSNCHKWLYVPRGCAVLYVPLRHQHLIRTTLPTSWGFIPAPTSRATRPSVMQGNGSTKSAFEMLFDFVATSDDTPYMCVPAALKFRSEVCGGDDRIYAYLEKLANEAADIVAGALGTEVMQEPGLKPGETSQIRRCGMTTVRLPIAIDRLAQSDIERLGKWIEGELMETYGTFVPMFSHGGHLWTRLSAQVYLEKSDFEWLASVLKELCGRVHSEYFGTATKTKL